MKKVFISIALLVGISLSSLAQTKEHKTRDRKNNLTKELNLTEDQQKKVEILNSEYKVKFEELRKNESLSKEDRRSKRKELFAQKDSAVKAILTPEQQTKLDAKKDGFEKRRSHARKGGRKTLSTTHKGRKNGDFSEKLNLTAEQKQKFENLNKEYRNKSKELAVERKKAIGEILTPEQQALLKSSKPTDKGQKNKFARNNKQGRDHKNFAHKDRRANYKLTQESIAKLDALEDSYFQEKQSIKRSRITPEMQEKKITDLRKKYREDRRNIVKENQKSSQKEA